MYSSFTNITVWVLIVLIIIDYELLVWMLIYYTCYKWATIDIPKAINLRKKL